MIFMRYQNIVLQYQEKGEQDESRICYLNFSQAYNQN